MILKQFNFFHHQGITSKPFKSYLMIVIKCLILVVEKILHSFIYPPFCVVIEKYKEDLEAAKQSQTHDEFYELDALSCQEYFGENQFDVCVTFDVIEHLTKEDGLKLLADMEKIASKRVIIFTPNGFLPQQGFEKGDFQEHLSGWDVDEMRKLGYNVIGLNGLKSLRTEHYRLKYKPQALWAIISYATLIKPQLYCVGII